ncbi:MAG: TonB family protein [Bdellovibrionaceae bacterium]|nr:TonB family protein [Pseudobdellovibrionaceae bacterium]MBX3034097.1 TonB family protein [Pseudobdellovibrionaceae bacterium]
MNAEERLRAPDEFKLGLIVSLCAHIAIVVLFIVRAIVFTGDAFESLPAIRVDIVGLPEKDQPREMPPPAKPEEPAGKPAPAPEPAKPKAEPLPAKTTPDAIKLDKSKNKQQEALERLKKMQALDQIREDVKKAEERQRLEAARAKAGAMKIKGNQLAPGTELTGIDKLQHEDYRNAVDRHIKPYWQLPEWLASKSYTALVLVKLDQQGRLISKQLMKTSGNPDFDASVLDTVDRAVPFPAPPEKFVAKAAVEGVLLEFGGVNQ